MTTGIKKCREAKGWSQYRLAKESGVSQGRISEIEAGKGSPSLGTLRALAKALGVTLDELAGERGTR